MLGFSLVNFSPISRYQRAWVLTNVHTSRVIFSWARLIVGTTASVDKTAKAIREHNRVFIEKSPYLLLNGPLLVSTIRGSLMTNPRCLCCHQVCPFGRCSDDNRRWRASKSCLHEILDAHSDAFRRGQFVCISTPSNMLHLHLMPYIRSEGAPAQQYLR